MNSLISRYFESFRLFEMYCCSGLNVIGSLDLVCFPACFLVGGLGTIRMCDLVGGCVTLLEEVFHWTFAFKF